MEYDNMGEQSDVVCGCTVYLFMVDIYIITIANYVFLFEINF